MKVYKKQRRSRPLVTVISVLMVLAGLGLIGQTFLGQGLGLGGIIGVNINAAEAPQDNSMTLTVPGMARVKDTPVYTAAADDTAALDRGAVHVEGTGFPWENGSNVYIAGHRLGYLGTDSFLQFRDLNKLQNGDEILLKDANGATYTYTVFNKMKVAPTDYAVTEPVPGKNIVSLQTCTMPTYTERLIVQGELTSVA